MYSVFHLIVFLITFLFESIVGNIVTVGNYSQLNHKTCGLSWHSIGMNTNLCLKWQKDVSSPVRGAMNARLGDAPWVVKLNYYRFVENNQGVIVLMNNTCTGAIISEQWILTAGHCMNGSFDIKIYLGYTRQNDSDYFDITNETYFHPEYDIALVKLNKSINEANTDNQTKLANSICLPEKWQGSDCKFNPTPGCELTEYGMLGGWGVGRHPDLDNLQMGFWRLYNARFILSNDSFEASFSKSLLVMHKLANHTSCGGDSGGPVWQYQMGRAVIVGVVQGGQKHDNWGCGKNGTNSYSTYVDQAIDWIKNVTMLN